MFVEGDPTPAERGSGAPQATLTCIGCGFSFPVPTGRRVRRRYCEDCEKAVEAEARERARRTRANARPRRDVSYELAARTAAYRLALEGAWGRLRMAYVDPTLTPRGARQAIREAAALIEDVLGPDRPTGGRDPHRCSGTTGSGPKDDAPPSCDGPPAV